MQVWEQIHTDIWVILNMPCKTAVQSRLAEKNGM